jgi:hypothetical protein
MTTPSAGPSSGILASPRTLAALGLVGYVALFEFFALIVWIGDTPSFALRSLNASESFLNLTVMAFPIVAVLVATRIAPAIAMARMVVLVALIEYVVAVGLGLITFLVGIGKLFDIESGLHGTRDLILGLAQIVLIAVAGYITFRTFTEMGGRITGPRATFGSQPPQHGGGQTYPQQQSGQYPGAQ